MFYQISMFYQIFLSSQVKQIVIISNKHGIYKLRHEFPNDLRLKEISRRSQIYIEL